MSNDPVTAGVKGKGFKEKAKHEFIEFLVIAGYLAFFFCSLATYTMLLMKRYEGSYFSYGFAILNALVIGKVILIGQMMNLGRGSEARPMYQSILFKAFIFSLVVFAFHIVEEFVKRVIQGEPAGTLLHNLDLDKLSARTIVIFCALIPLFTFTEFRRALGEEKIYGLLMKPWAADTVES
jgi:magnesium-transporting ATPase (P-type)